MPSEDQMVSRRHCHLTTALLLLAFLLLALLKTPASSNDAHSFSSHSSTYKRGRTAVFDKIFTISLKNEAERHTAQDALMRRMGLKTEFFDAIDAKGPEIARIMQSIRSDLSLDADAPIPFLSWKDLVLQRPGRAAAGDDDDDDDEEEEKEADIRALQNPGLDEADYYWTPEAHTHELDASLLGRASETRTQSAGALACWQSHYRLLRDVVRRRLATALILEDDVDFETDFVQQAADVMDSLADTPWDIIFFGYCWSDEDARPAIPTSPDFPTVHPSTRPQCTHAYAVSAVGAAKIVRLLRTHGFAYTRPIDHAYSYLIQSGLINSFSVSPAPINQAKGLVSAIGGNRQDSLRQTVLLDSLRVRLGLMDPEALQISNEEHQVYAWRMKGVKNGWQWDG